MRRAHAVVASPESIHSFNSPAAPVGHVNRDTLADGDEPLSKRIEEAAESDMTGASGTDELKSIGTTTSAPARSDNDGAPSASAADVSSSAASKDSNASEIRVPSSRLDRLSAYARVAPSTSVEALASRLMSRNGRSSAASGRSWSKPSATSHSGEDDGVMDRLLAANRGAAAAGMPSSRYPSAAALPRSMADDSHSDSGSDSSSGSERTGPKKLGAKKRLAAASALSGTAGRARGGTGSGGGSGSPGGGWQSAHTGRSSVGRGGRGSRSAASGASHPVRASTRHRVKTGYGDISYSEGEEEEEEDDVDFGERSKKKKAGAQGRGRGRPRGGAGGGAVRRSSRREAVELLAELDEEEDDVQVVSGSDDDDGESYESNSDSDSEDGGRKRKLVRRIGTRRTAASGDADGEGGEDEDEDDSDGGKAARGRGSAWSSRASVAEADELVASSACLKYLPKSDRRRFVQLWVAARRIEAAQARAVQAGQASEDGGGPGAAASAASVAESVGDDRDRHTAFVTPERLLKVLGWGVTGAGSLASSGTVGTSAAATAASAAAGASAEAASASSASSAPPAPRLCLTTYQLLGLSWLLLLRSHSLNGILADEMGLGKSVQTIALIEWLRATKKLSGPVLIVAPASILTNWLREFNKWAPELRVHTYRGNVDRLMRQHQLRTGIGLEKETGRAAEEEEAEAEEAEEEKEKAKQKKPKKVKTIDVDGDAVVITDSEAESSGTESETDDEQEDEEDEAPAASDDDDEDDDGNVSVDSEAGAATAGNPDAPRAFDVLLVTYNVFDREGETGNINRAFLKGYQWDTLICDEGHQLKNQSGNRFRHLTRLKALRRLLLSGTPVQNSIPELFALLRFLDPDIFTHSVANVFTAAVTNGSASQKKAVLADLRSIVQPFVLRRQKADVLKDLPAKTEVLVTLSMPPSHAAVWTAAVAQSRSQLGLSLQAGEGRSGGASAASSSSSSSAISGDADQLLALLSQSAADDGMDDSGSGTPISLNAAGRVQRGAAAKAVSGISQAQLMDRRPMHTLNQALKRGREEADSATATTGSNASSSGSLSAYFPSTSAKAGAAASLPSTADSSGAAPPPPTKRIRTGAESPWGSVSTTVHAVDISIDLTDSADADDDAAAAAPAPASAAAAAPRSNVVAVSAVDGDGLQPVVAPADDAATAALARRIKTAGAKKSSSIMGTLRLAAQHPLMVRTWYSNPDTLRQIADALLDVGFFSDGATRKKAYESMETDNDLEIYIACRDHADMPPHYLPPAEMPLTEAELSSDVMDAASKPVVPITLPRGLRGRALLRAAVDALPSWAFEASAKAQYLRTQLRTWLAEGHRVLIFSQLKQPLTILGVCCERWGIRYCRLDGDIGPEARQSLLDAFYKDTGIGVFLLTTRAGGMGLNLVAADTVVIHDSDWNPHGDHQAIDRAHRLGQTRPVRVFRLLAANTLDVHVHRTATEKRKLDEALKGGDKAGGKGGKGGGAGGGRGGGPAASTAALLLAEVLQQGAKG